MRIGLITGEYPPMRGGIATQTKILARELIHSGHAVHVLTATPGHEENPGVHLHPLMTDWGIGIIRQVKNWTRENRLDVINLHYQTAAYNMSPIIHLLPQALTPIAPYVTTFHDLRFPYLFPKAGPLRPWIVDHMARKSSGVVATNPEDAIHLQTLNQQHTLIPIGSNITITGSSSADARAHMETTPDSFVLAFFGFVNHSKGLDILIDSLATLRQNGVDARLLMIGDRTGSSDPTNADYNSEIDTSIAQHDLGDVVHWTGYVSEPDVRAYLRTADAVVMPFRDGASYRRSSLTSAIDCGTAIVTTIPTVETPTFIDAENLMLVPPNNSPALTAALTRLYNNPSLQQTLRAGAAKLSREFSWPRIVTAYQEFYRRLVEESA